MHKDNKTESENSDYSNNKNSNINRNKSEKKLGSYKKKSEKTDLEKNGNIMK